jgi:hypothetical protein
MKLQIIFRRTALVCVASALNVSALAQTFMHPCCLHTQADLDRMRTNVATHVQPWVSGFDQFAADSHSSSNYVMRGPFGAVDRGTSNLNCKTFEQDGMAAYHQALMWSITGYPVYRDKALKILKSWTATNTVFSGKAAQLIVGLIGFKFVNAAEIMRYDNSGMWSPAEIAATERWFKNNFWPWLEPSGAPTGGLDGNWGMAALKCQIAIAVFCNDLTKYNSALALMTNGCASIPGSIMSSGQETETGRDVQHWQLALGDMAEYATIANNNGNDLFALDDNRLLTGFEYAAKYFLSNSVSYKPWKTCLTLKDYPHISPRDGHFRPIYEMVYNHYQSKGIIAPYTQQICELIRPEGPMFNGDHPGFGTLFWTLDSPPKPRSGSTDNAPTAQNSRPKK